MPTSSFSAPPLRARTSSSASRTATRPSPRTPTSILLDDPEGEYVWDAPGSECLNAPAVAGTAKRRSRRHKKKDEPMKPITVILYVVFFYLIWQILTRSTDVEILSHLSPSSPHHYHLSSLLPESTSSPYHLPYQFPQFPSPLPPTSPATPGASSPSTTRWILGLLMYPFYILLLPLPLLLNALYLVLAILSTLLYPLTSMGRILAQIFVRTPYAWARAVGAAVYPLYVFVGGMVGVGCVLGLGAGWAGKKCLEWAIGTSPAAGPEQYGRPSRVELDDVVSRTSRHPDLVYRAKHSRSRQYSASSSDDSSPPHNPRTPRSRKFSSHVPVLSLYPQDSVSRRGGEVRGKGKERAMSSVSFEREEGRGTGREGVVIGTRRRGVRYEDE